jgi:hypothetical protein
VRREDGRNEAVAQQAAATIDPRLSAVGYRLASRRWLGAPMRRPVPTSVRC